MLPNPESVVDLSEPFSGFVVCCIQCYSLEVFHKRWYIINPLYLYSEGIRFEFSMLLAILIEWCVFSVSPDESRDSNRPRPPRYKSVSFHHYVHLPFSFVTIFVVQTVVQ
jgi:hypothetical protein